nr:hypothetical protein [Candidatus Sigynarchaeota archaeon]
MTLSGDHLSRLRDKDESGLWDLASALMQVQETILRMEEHTDDPDLLRALSGHALATGRELASVLATLESSVDDD